MVNIGIEESGNVDEDIALLRASVRSRNQPAVGSNFERPSCDDVPLEARPDGSIKG